MIVQRWRLFRGVRINISETDESDGEPPFGCAQDRPCGRVFRFSCGVRGCQQRARRLTSRRRRFRLRRGRPLRLRPTLSRPSRSNPPRFHPVRQLPLLCRRGPGCRERYRRARYIRERSLPARASRAFVTNGDDAVGFAVRFVEVRIGAEGDVNQRQTGEGSF